MLRSMGKKKTYTAAPTVPAEVQAKYLAVMEVLSGQTTVSEAARKLGMSRNHFQTLMHRAQEGMIAGLMPGQPGRPAKPVREVELERELLRSRREQEDLAKRQETSDKLIDLAKLLLQGPLPRLRRAKKKAATTTAAGADEEDDSEPDPWPVWTARKLDEFGLPRSLVAEQLGFSESTLRRWRTWTPKKRKSRRKPPPQSATEAAVNHVRELRGLCGADGLRRAHAGLSRRQALDLKRNELTAMERERKEESMRVTVHNAGVVRGFDAMDLGRSARSRYVLAAADAAVPFRTSLAAALAYDAKAVERALERDFAGNGVPYVLRFDRASVHRDARVLALLEHHGVLVLHGPARHPRYYGQLERQNREHRAWLEALPECPDDDLERTLERMRDALNGRWRRPSLGHRTASEVWHARPEVHFDRTELRELVAERARHLRARADHDKLSVDLVQRLAIEQTLTSLGWLTVKPRSGC
jgi:transposase-like protein